MGGVKSKNKKNKRGTLGLGSMFEAYILLMGFALLIWAGISLFAFNLLINAGVIYPANYAEYRISDAFEQIKTADEVTADLIPEVCRYVVFSEDGKVLSGDLGEKDVETAWNVLSNNNYSDGRFYKIIIRPAEYVVLQYRLKPQYKSMWMNEHLPNPENLLTIFILICCLGIMQIFAKKFGSSIRRKMTPMRDALEQIRDRNLDFKINYSGVREIDECLAGLDDMRYALKTSLQKQWETEQEKNRQMSALAHDIKTPLTVVRGNSELLLETELTEEQKNYADYISESALQIQNYVQTLIEVTKSQEGISQAPVKVNISDVIADIKKQTLGLSEVYQLQINWREELENSESAISIVYDHVVRAVMNVVRNAAEHTPKGGVMNIMATYKGGEFVFAVEDSGCGFTPEALAHGTEQFFMDDSSRTGGSHYGIGLFFAKKVAKEHGGKIILANSKETCGAKVEISFISQT
ncbi:sensor histidine kinase [Butyrivibrio sp. YAB3001]|uniref:sensor histidine kinase n=1 Tax=Butyrivibrio sp. YAB3001 TaxID=1520812 RepID=UPI0008F621F9|nr:HAMP domain-containing sensor histidine kinase [Butyrivibrio sp. YAB3001]SFC10058.1 Signal transduction histidine kinase [Butyrivibrio sp. YAB3001]